MEQCPVCSITGIPGWRRTVSRTQRFQCPNCSTWLIFRNPRTVRSAFIARIGNIYLFAFLLGLAPPAFILAFGAALLYFLCYSPWRWSDGVGLWLLGSMLAVALWSAFTDMKRSTLEQARYQDGRRSLDGVREMRALIATPEGRKGAGVLLVVVVTMVAAMPLTMMVAKRLPSVLPGLCTFPVKHHERSS
jgi:hypothetical protein